MNRIYQIDMFDRRCTPRYIEESANLEEHDAKTRLALVLLFCVFLVGIILIMGGCAYSAELPGKQYDICSYNRKTYIEGYSLDQWADSIHKSEGNDNYGILSVQCSKGEGCRKICKNTIRNNYKRWKRSKSSVTYLQFLGSRYAPVGTSARPVGNDPRGLNKNWQVNVYYWLIHT